MFCDGWKVVGKVSNVDGNEMVVVELVVVDVDGKPGCTGNGFDPFCALLAFPVVLGIVATAGYAAAAACSKTRGCLARWKSILLLLAVVAATTTACLDETVGGQCVM